MRVDAARLSRDVHERAHRQEQLRDVREPVRDWTGMRRGSVHVELSQRSEHLQLGLHQPEDERRELRDVRERLFER